MTEATLVQAEGVTAAFNGDAVEALAARSPDWLAELRRDAWTTYERTPLPTTALEEWRYTEVSQLGLDAYRLADDAPAAEAIASARALLDGRDASGHVVIVDGVVVETSLDPELARQGVVLTDLAAAVETHADVVREYLAREVTPAFSKFAALSAALWTGGVFLHVPRGVRIERPIRVARWISTGGIAVFPRTLIVAEPTARIDFVDEMRSHDLDEPSFTAGAVEVIARDGAQVHYVALQRWGRGVRHLSMQKTIASRDADLDTLVVNLGGDVARVDLQAWLDGPGARSDMLGLYFAERDQHFDHNTRQDHKSPHAESDLLYKGALYDSSRAVFRGIIRVHPGAQHTDAYQTNRNLLLSDAARADSLPNLEIEADDVKCSHGATVGQLDEEELFYLMARGIPRAQAERLVVFGFFGEVLGRLPMPGVVEELREAIAAKIG
ncbi:MAG TPA: Fe-S cluster assembly protein SufD [Thermoanaerobaculia bacterium]